jgi:hypothetical protein
MSCTASHSCITLIAAQTQYSVRHSVALLAFLSCREPHQRVRAQGLAIVVLLGMFMRTTLGDERGHACCLPSMQLAWVVPNVYRCSPAHFLACLGRPQCQVRGTRPSHLLLVGSLLGYLTSGRLLRLLHSPIPNRTSASTLRMYPMGILARHLRHAHPLKPPMSSTVTVGSM